MLSWIFQPYHSLKYEMQTLTRSMKIMKMMMVMSNKPKLVGRQDANMTAYLFYANKCSMLNIDLDHNISADSVLRLKYINMEYNI